VEVVASLSQDHTAAAQCGLFTHKSVTVIFEPPCTLQRIPADKILLVEGTSWQSFHITDCTSGVVPCVFYWKTLNDGVILRINKFKYFSTNRTAIAIRQGTITLDY